MSVFKFKKFNIIQERSAMKVGTDGVLLGSWVSCEKRNRILDVGSGTGLISLMVAQRNLDCKITGIEIDKDAFLESQLNVKNSNWKKRIKLYNVSLQKFTSKSKFDVVVSNPPFFPANKSKEKRDVARHTNSLSFKDLIHYSTNLLSKNGVFCVIIPKKSQEYICTIAKEYKLFYNRVCYVKGNKSSKVKRVLMEFSFIQSVFKKEHLVIEKSRHEYTDQYVHLCQKFYLNM